MRLVVKNVPSLERFAEKLKGADNRVLAQSLNREMQKERTVIRRSIADVTGAPYGRIVSVVRDQKATAGNLDYAIRSEDEFLPLSAFGAREVRSGVTAAPWKVRRVFPGAFMRGGHRGARTDAPSLNGQVFAREGKGRLPIRKLWGPAIPREMTRDDGAPVGTWRRAVAELPPRILAEIERRMAVGK